MGDCRPVAAVAAASGGAKTQKPVDLSTLNNVLWKINKMKYVMTVMMCSKCQSFNYYNKHTQIVGDRVNVGFSLCTDCVKANIDTTSTYMNFVAKTNKIV